MNRNVYHVCALIFFFLGIFLWAYSNEWIIFRYPHALVSDLHQGHAGYGTIKKKVKLIFWRHDKWVTEHQEIIWPSCSSDAIFYLINSWLTLLDDDAVMDKKVTLQTAILSPSKSIIYLSFDRYPLPTECSTFTSWMWVEGLLKTMRENGIQLDAVQLLVHHQPLMDDRLDFSNPWPMRGFLG